LRVPALYKDGDWEVPKSRLSREELVVYRNSEMSPETNRALAACAAFRGDVLIVESEHDAMVPHPVIQNYLSACAKAQSLTYRMISDADHALSEKEWQQTYTTLLVNWMAEMVLGARAGKTGTAALAPQAAAAEPPPREKD
ncbi:MAG: alpha/beta hydrolase, partial [Ramlibacter sp.]